MLEFGRILRYSDRGFGFISRELYKNAGEAYFHITTIKRKYSQLTQAIDKGKWRNVSLFYVTQHGQKGDAVSDVWLDVSDLPEELKAELKNFLRLYWHNLSDELSVHVERFCHKLYNTEELNNLKNQRERRVQIKEFCNERKISKLVHFTQICNLENILTNGLLSRDQLDAKGIRYYYNDNIRIDDCRDAVCLSISFPNYQMFYKYRQADSGKRWVVLVLDASVLWELDCAFCRENAASRSVTQIPLNERKRFSALEAMFGDLPNCRRQELNIPDNYPTHPQAEVLVFEPIPVSYIREIHFRDKADIMEPRVNFPELLSPMACCISELYFGPRQDWPFWRNQPYGEILLDQDILDAPF